MKLPELLKEVAELEARTLLRGIEGTAVDAMRYEKELMPELAKHLKLSMEALDSMVRQFGMRDDGTKFKGLEYSGPVLSTGGLSALEEAFRVLGWDEPHPVPEDRCAIGECPKHATCGRPAKDGGKYLRICGDHYMDSSW